MDELVGARVQRQIPRLLAFAGNLKMRHAAPRLPEVPDLELAQLLAPQRMIEQTKKLLAEDKDIIPVVFAEKVPDRLANKNPIRTKPGESADAIADRDARAEGPHVQRVRTIRSSKPALRANSWKSPVASLPSRAVPSQTITACSRDEGPPTAARASPCASRMMASFAAA